MLINICLFIYIYIYIERERERERCVCVCALKPIWRSVYIFIMTFHSVQASSDYDLEKILNFTEKY